MRRSKPIPKWVRSWRSSVHWQQGLAETPAELVGVGDFRPRMDSRYPPTAKRSGKRSQKTSGWITDALTVAHEVEGEATGGSYEQQTGPIRGIGNGSAKRLRATTLFT